MGKNWLEAMIERLQMTAEDIKKKKREGVAPKDIAKHIDHEAFENVFLLVVNGFIRVKEGFFKDGRNTPEYRNWRKKVLKRDNYTCRHCGSKFNLEVDHIKSVYNFPHLITVVSNGRVLCNKCHRKTDNYGSRVKYCYGK